MACTDDAVDVEVWLTRSWHTIGEGGESIALGDGIEERNETTVDARHYAGALHAELEVRRN